ncbi:MAG: aminopeptidase [bacterium]
MPKKVNYKDLEKQLVGEKKSAWEIWDEKNVKNAFEFCEGYKEFLDKAKTEREAVRAGIEMAGKAGFRNIEEFKTPQPPFKKGGKLKMGDKVYAVNRGKNLILAVIGKKILEDGARIVMSHVDSPRLDLKVNPLYEDEQIAFFKTHYYGGIKKYHWPTIQLALHGTVVFENGKKIELSIGEKESDPIFMITDLLPHLAKNQAKKPLSEAIVGEELNIVVGSIPVKDENVKEKVKLAVLEYLNKEYDIKNEDFFSAEIQAVPSSKARDLGFDRSMIAAYGQDDRVCAYSSLRAIFECKEPDKTQICFWTDKEEIGSEGNTGAQSLFLDKFIIDLLGLCGANNNMENLYSVFKKTEAISSDVTAGLDPDYKEVFDLKNCARLGYGIAFEKYNGYGGKYNSSEASAEYIAKLRNIFNKNKIVWQTASLGKVDEGGGGTIAMYLAKRDMEVIDAGVPLFNMHAPLEISSKADIYSAYLGYKAFLQ